MNVTADIDHLRDIGDEQLDLDKLEVAWMFYGAAAFLEGVPEDRHVDDDLERDDFEDDASYEQALAAWRAGWRVAFICNGFPTLAPTETRT